MDRCGDRDRVFDRISDSRGFARPDRWYCGLRLTAAGPTANRGTTTDEPHAAAARIAAHRRAQSMSTGRKPRAHARSSRAARAGHALSEADIVRLFSVEGRDLDEVIAAANELRHEASATP